MDLTNYYILKGTSEKIYGSLFNDEPIDSQVFDIWNQALAWNIKKQQFDNVPEEYLVLEHFLKAQYTYSHADDKEGFTLGAIYGLLDLLDKLLGE